MPLRSWTIGELCVFIASCWVDSSHAQALLQLQVQVQPSDSKREIKTKRTNKYNLSRSLKV